MKRGKGSKKGQRHLMLFMDGPLKFLFNICVRGVFKKSEIPSIIIPTDQAFPLVIDSLLEYIAQDAN